MKTIALASSLALCSIAACGTEIDADPGSVEMAAALSLEPIETDVRPVDRLQSSTQARRGAATSSSGAGGGEGATDHVIYSVLYSENDVEVGARAAGVVRSLHADLGDHVAAGEVLAVLEDALERAAVEAADAELDLVRAEHARAASLAEQHVITTAEMEQAVYRLRAAQARSADARARLERTRVRSPFAGAVSRRFVRLGASLEEGEPLFRVTALRPLRAQVRVPELAARAIQPGDPVHLGSLDGRAVAGAVGRISPTIDPASGTVEVLVDIEDPGSLQPGATVTVSFGQE